MLSFALQGAIAEAAFMTGMERNSEVVQLAAYAPLLANVNHKGALCPTNLVIYDNSRYFCLRCLTTMLFSLSCAAIRAVSLHSRAGQCVRRNVYFALVAVHFVTGRHQSVARHWPAWHDLQQHWQLLWVLNVDAVSV